MSHQSGIRASNRVAAQLAEAQTSAVRAIQAVIVGEELAVNATCKIHGTWEDDYNSSVLPWVQDDRPCYIFYRLDLPQLNSVGGSWALITWMPSNATVREKMLYASTRATLKRQFGDHLITFDLNGTTRDDVDLNGFKSYISMRSAPPPLTQAEEFKARELSHEHNAGFYGAKQTTGSISFDITEIAGEVIEKFIEGAFCYVQLNIDMDLEKITVAVSARQLEPQGIASHTPENEGRYHLYRFHYTREHEKRASLFFIHSIAGYKSSVKSRMLYSSCKAALLFRLEQQFSLNFDHRLETDSIREITADYLLDVLYPKVQEPKLKFDKPQGPTGRRPRKQV